MALHFVADLHFNSDDTAYARKHGFTDTAEMTRRICANWRSCVNMEDTVYIVGNVGNPVHLGCLPGIKHLVRAAPDPFSVTCLATGWFASVSDIQILHTEAGSLTLVHDPHHAPGATGKVLHGGIPLDPISPDHHCIAAAHLEWSPVSLDRLFHLIAPLPLHRAA